MAIPAARGTVMTVIDRAGARLSFREEGAGSPVLLVHSTANTADQWAGLSAHLARRFHVIAPDLPGNGASGLPAAPSGLGAHVAALEALADHCGEPVHVVGHSFGAAVALKLAITQPEAVRSLTIIEPAAFHLLAHSSRADRRLFGEITALAGAVASAACADAPDVGVGRFVDFWNGEGTWARIGAGTRAILVKRIGNILADFGSAFAETWEIGALGAIRRPVLCLMGMASPRVARRTIRVVADAIPGAQFHMVAGAGHMLPITHPEILDPIVSGHLTAADASTGRRGGIPRVRAA